MGNCNCTGKCSCSIQPTQTRLVRNVNASCTPACPTTPKCCTRKEWLTGIDCSHLCFSIDDCQLGVEQGAIAQLPAVFKNGAGTAVDPIEPRITIKDPLGVVFLQSQPMTKESVGSYFFLFGTNNETIQGVWRATVTGVIDGIRVSDSYLFCVLPVGSIPFNLCGDGYGPADGYGDGYGYGPSIDGYGYGPNIEDGAVGFGTFAGREECGFDGGGAGGCSNDIPATGGCRTNRSEVGDGFWDGISNEESCVTPIGKRGQCMKDRAVAMTRVKLKDIVPECWAFCEDEIDMYLETSLADFNAWPTFTCFTWDTLPETFLGVLALGAQVFALYAQGLLESGREFTITDNGISFTPPQISSYMQSTASALLQHYTELRENIKRNIKPQPAGIGTFRVTSLLPTLARLRHLREKQII